MGSYVNLSREALRKGVRLWKLIPKFHFFLHLVEHQVPRWGNPRIMGTYSDEDLQRIMKGVALSCPPLNLAPMVMYNWLSMKLD